MAIHEVTDEEWDAVCHACRALGYCSVGKVKEVVEIKSLHEAGTVSQSAKDLEEEKRCTLQGDCANVHFLQESANMFWQSVEDLEQEKIRKLLEAF